MATIHFTEGGRLTVVETCDEFCKKVQIHSTEFSRLYNRKRASSLHLLSVKDDLSEVFLGSIYATEIYQNIAAVITL